MNDDNVIQFINPDKASQDTHDLLTETIRNGARRMLAAAIEAEAEEFITQYQQQLSDGKNRLVRNGYLPEREIVTGIGDVSVKVPRVRDRSEDKQERFKFVSSIVPHYLRRSGDMNELLPILYLKGISTGDFRESLAPIVGSQAKGLSQGVVSRLKAKWEDEYKNWLQRDLSGKNYVYWWADGIYLGARMEHEKQCVLVIMGVADNGEKQLIGIETGFRESTDSWKELMLSLRERGLSSVPKVAVGDGQMGFWAALDKVYPGVKHQRCWFHKMGNVLEKMPKSLQAKAKAELQEIWMSDTQEMAGKAFDSFIKKYEEKYPKAVECLTKDKDVLLTFYDFPAAHWIHLRTTNPIESTFATVRHRTKKSKNCHSYTTIMAMVFKLFESAAKRWIKIRGFHRLADVIRNVRFKDGEPVINEQEQLLKVSNS